MDTNIVCDVKGCARCGGDHVSLTFNKFTHPVCTYVRKVEGFEGQPNMTHWAMCPTVKEPILLGHTDD